MTDFEKAIHRTSIQKMRSLFVEGVDPETYHQEPVAINYEERISRGERPLMEFIEKLYPDGNVRDAVFDLVSKAIIVNQEVYTELGMRLGAQTIFELLRIDPVKEWHREDNKNG